MNASLSPLFPLCHALIGTLAKINRAEGEMSQGGQADGREPSKIIVEARPAACVFFCFFLRSREKVFTGRTYVFMVKDL